MPETKRRIKTSIKRRKEWWVLRDEEIVNHPSRYHYFNGGDLFLCRFHENGRLIAIYITRNGKPYHQYQNGLSSVKRHQRMASEWFRQKKVLFDPNRSNPDETDLQAARVYRQVYLSENGAFQGFVDDLDLQ